MDFSELLSRVKQSSEGALIKGRVLAFDPGMTTGYAVIEDNHVMHWGELATPSVAQAVPNFDLTIKSYLSEIIVCEEYRIYHHKTKHHGGSDLFTARVIGCIETLAHQHGLDVIFQSAHVAKQFVTDERLKEWHYWVRGQRHSRDAIRHACYYRIFGPPKKAITRKPKDGGRHVG